MQVVGAQQLRAGSSPSPSRASAALAVGVAVVVALLCGLVPGLRVLAHLLVVLAAAAVAVLEGRRRGLVVAAATATVAGLVGVLATSEPSALQWLGEAVAAALAAGVVVLLVTRRASPPTPAVEEPRDVPDAAGATTTDTVDAAVLAFADADATGSTADALAAGLQVVLPGAQLESLRVGAVQDTGHDMAGLVLGEAASAGRRALLPAGFSGHEHEVLVGFSVRHGDTEAGGVVVRAAADVADGPLDRVEDYLRRVAPTLAAHATADLWAEIDPDGGRSSARDGDLAAMLSRAAHDLRVPLGSLTGAVETLMTHDEALGGDGRADVYEILHRSTRRVAEWIGVLLEESLGPSRVVPRTRPVELGPVLAEAAENARAATAGLDVSVEETDLLVEADPGLVIRVVTNLLANAGHHAAEGGAVEVRTFERGDRVQVRVIDHGPGIDLESLSDRAAGGTADVGRDGPGLGIGLDSARSIVHAWGGQFGIGRTPGGGATVWFTLPLTSARADGVAETDGQRRRSVRDRDAGPVAGSMRNPTRRAPSEPDNAAAGADSAPSPPDDHADVVAGDGHPGDAAARRSTTAPREPVGTTPASGRQQRVRWTVVGPDLGSLPAVFREPPPRP